MKNSGAPIIGGGGGRGFTLIELLVVIAIIAVLAAIIFPVFSSVRRKSYQTTCLSNLRQIGMATLMYAQDYDDMLLWGGDPNDLNGGWEGAPDEKYFSDMKAQPDILFPYTKNKQIWKCPADIGIGEGVGGAGVVMAPPSPNSFTTFASSYYSNTRILLLKKPIATMEAFAGGKSIGGPASIGYFFDGSGYWHGGSKANQVSYRYNFAYLDGHVKSVSMVDYTNLWALQVR
jgi:prepilin-type N-terminal cleavage/methylation domain-containing protein/prepilin-type processing-associated H-X9-DG protein